MMLKWWLARLLFCVTIQALQQQTKVHKMEFQKILNDGIVTVFYELEDDGDVDYGTMRVEYKGIDITEIVSLDDWMWLRMACDANYEQIKLNDAEDRAEEILDNRR